MNNTLLPGETIQNKIYTIRGQKVMLDSDLAELYGVETRVLNQAVRRNNTRFPQDFMFQLTTTEWEVLISQLVISNAGRGGRRKIPYVFTEHGVLMLSSVLNSETAIMINIEIVRIFSRLRNLYIDNTELRLEIERIKTQLKTQDQNIGIVFTFLEELSRKTAADHTPAQRKRIGYKPDNN